MNAHSNIRLSPHPGKHVFRYSRVDSEAGNLNSQSTIVLHITAVRYQLLCRQTTRRDLRHRGPPEQISIMVFQSTKHFVKKISICLIQPVQSDVTEAGILDDVRLKS